VKAPRPSAVALLASTLVLACGGGEEAAEVGGRPVTLVAVQSVDLADRIEATGELLAEEDARIAAEVGGRVTEILVDEGAAAEAGQAILAIDPERRRLERDAARARLQEARAAFQNQESETARVEELHRRGVASETQLDGARTALSLARSRLEGAEADFGVAERALRDATVRAPFAGMVSERFVGRGEYVTQGQALFHLVALDPISVEFHLPEVDSGRVQTGQQVDVRVDSHPGEVFQARVSVVAPTIDPRTRTLRVKARLDNAESRLKPGLFARVDLGVATRPGVRLVPEEAILRRADGAVVFRLGAENRVERLLVQTGVTRGGVVEVVRGLEPGDMIVSRGHATLVDGEVVTPRHPDGSLVQPPADVASEGGGSPG
jgi:membrane fusion protein (multidrug efflux system)